MTAPEKIYVLPAYNDGKSSAPMTVCGPDFAHSAVEYTRTDLVQAAIASAMMGAAEYLYQMMMDVSDETLQQHINFIIADMGEKGQPSYAAHLRDNLLASIPTTALDAIKQQARHDSKLDALEAKLDQAVQALRFADDGANHGAMTSTYSEYALRYILIGIRERARTVLAELEKAE